MKKNKKSLAPFHLHREAGLTTTEYALAGALVSLGIVLAFSDLGAAIAIAIVEMAKAIIN